MYSLVGTIMSRAFRVRWMLEELGASYDYIDAKPHEPTVIKHNPDGKIPVLLDNDIAISDSTAILTYLADKHDKLTFTAGTPERAKQDSLTNCILDEFDALLWTAARHSFILPKERRVPEVKEALKWEFERNQKALAAKMKDGPFLMGNALTVPDFILGHCLGWAITAKFGISEPKLSDYLNTLKQRPAYQAARTDAA